MRLALRALCPVWVLVAAAGAVLSGCNDDGGGGGALHDDADASSGADTVLGEDLVAAPDALLPDGSDSDEDLSEAPVPFAARFELGPGGTAPFPFDLFTRADGSSPTGLRVEIDAGQTRLIDRALDVGLGTEAMLEGLRALDGFSTFAPITLALGGGAVDPASLPTPAGSLLPTASVYLIDVDPSSPHRGERHEVVVSSASIVRLAVIVLAPVRPLRPGTTYAAVVTTGVRSVAGESLRPAPTFLAAVGLGDDPEADPAEVARARAALAPLVAAVPDLDGVAVATVFTTQSATRTLAALRDAVEAGVVPPALVLEDLDEDGAPDLYTPETLDAAPSDLADTTGVGPIVRGHFQVADFRDEGGWLELSPEGVPVVGQTTTVPFVLVLPQEPAAQPFPLAVLQHGAGARKEFALHVAGHLAREGIAVIAIDLPGHGEQAVEGQIIDINNVPRMRGTLLQHAANLMALFEATAALEAVDLVPVGAPDGVSDLDLETPLVYIGESMGGITGSLAVAASSRVESAVLNVAGGGLYTMMGPFVAAFIRDELTRVQLAIVMQTLADAADPVNVAHWLREPPRGEQAPTTTLMQVVIGDTTLSNAASAALAVAAGVPVVCPCPEVEAMALLERVQAPTTGYGLVLFGDSKHGVLLGDHARFPESAAAMREQMVDFLVPAIRGEEPPIDLP